MQIIYSTHNLSLPQSIATIGFFDGVHLGHQYLIKQLIAEAQKRQLASVVVTFSDHPANIIHNKRIELLTPLEEKLTLLSKENIDYCIVLPFTKELSALSARTFMEQILKKELNVHALYIGYDNRFGHRLSNKEGFEDYVSYGKECGVEIIEAKALLLKEIEISSSLIRNLLKEGNLSLANKLLGRPYTLVGNVTFGKRIGRTLGYPTANIKPAHQQKVIPSDGVYAVSVRLNGSRYRGMLNIGCRPTIKNGKTKTIEVHILDFQREVYQQDIELVFEKYLRKEIEFKDKKALIEQLQKDEETVRHFFENKKQP
ncbi:MAG: riboflavin biosynthesis protein RibF [Bacteroidales bacterium]|nr:riboflavin biosynthesis protein RibF [Bacteroidales bacterium]